MSEHSPISWTDATWPIVAGCEYASPGCSNCWAVRDSWRLAHNPNPKVHNAYFGTVDKRPDGKLVWSGIVRELWDRLDWPLKWRGEKKVFVCSQADLFHQRVSFEFIAAVFGIGALCPEHTLQILTKHPARARAFFAWLEGERGRPLESCLWYARRAISRKYDNRGPFADDPPPWPLENVWFGVTVEDQRRADERVPELLRVPAAKRWLSVEPMLESIDLTNIRTFDEGHTERGTHHDLADLDWIVCGGESAQTRAHTRPFDLAWARALRDQCRAAGVPFFMKQLGTKPINWPVRAQLDPADPWPRGKTSRYKWHEPEHWPEDLRVQEFPA